MSSTVTPETAAFNVRLPDSWIEFDVWRATRTGDVARLIDARIAAEPTLRPKRGALLKLLRKVAEDAERQGVVFCAAMTDVDDEVGMLAATAMAFYTDGSDDTDVNTVETIAAQITASADSEGWTYRHVEIVAVPAGGAVRVYGVEPVNLPDNRVVSCVMMQTLVPLPDRTGVLNLVLSTPQIHLAQPFLELFQAISGTLSWAPSN